MPVFCAALDIDCSVFMALSMSAPPFPSRGCPLCSSQILAVVLCFCGEVIEGLLWMLRAYKLWIRASTLSAGKFFLW